MAKTSAILAIETDRGIETAYLCLSRSRLFLSCVCALRRALHGTVCYLCVPAPRGTEKPYFPWIHVSAHVSTHPESAVLLTYAGHLF